MLPEGGVDSVDVEDMIRRFYHRPNQYCCQGKVVLAGYVMDGQVVKTAQDALARDDIQTIFLQTAAPPRFQMAMSQETVSDLYADMPNLDGFMLFACCGPPARTVYDNANGEQASMRENKLYVAGLCPSYNSANLSDFHGVRGYGAMWEGVIRDNADWVSIITWNDFNEDSGLMPNRWPPGADKAYYDRDETFLNITAYYNAWYKTGVQPAIPQDKLYYAYRTRGRWQHAAWNAEKAQWIDISKNDNRQSMHSVDQIHDDVRDMLYTTAFLTAPAELTIRLGSETRTTRLPAGISQIELPLQPGVPEFILRRAVNGTMTVLADVCGRRQIIAKETKENSLDGTHLVNRTWASGVAVGPVKRLEVTAATLHPATTLVHIGNTAAALTTEKAGSGVTFPVTGLTTGTYNVRIVYSNPGENDARLTMLADGSPRLGADAYYIPAFMPPTGKNRFATVSCFWSLYTNTTALRLQWMPAPDWDKPTTVFDDQGSVAIAAIELVRVNDVALPEVKERTCPELVNIPGGSFTMGSAAGAPDDLPVHRVSISPFAIGKYPVTNEEFERFDLTHRAFRDDYSWRDRQPVVYVAWQDAVRYCNWLSRQNGLTPVYDEKTWTADLSADGFRLPTEAEWEYVASGRDEGRKYPWGNSPPEAKYGVFKSLDVALSFDPLHNGEENECTSVVGSHPAGDSRDGVSDLCGNVCQWCTDWYNAYPSTPQIDPCNLTPHEFRVHRGGSYGFYSNSPRCTARECNAQLFAGYIVYIGFRVVLPQQSYLKLQK